MIYGNSWLTENYLVDTPDLYYNIDKFENGTTNILFITGYSGSGKSTLSRELAAKYQVELVEYDLVTSCYKLTDSRLYEKSKIIYEFFKVNPLAIKYRSEVKGKSPGNFDYSVKVLFPEFINFVESKNIRCIIEGMQVGFTIQEGVYDIDFFKNYAFVLKGTSAFKSSYRSIKRDYFENMKSEPWIYAKKAIRRFLKNLYHMKGNELLYNKIRSKL